MKTWDGFGTVSVVVDAISHAKEVPPQQRIGVYSGTLGIAWSLLEVGRILGDGDWTNRAVGLLARD